MVKIYNYKKAQRQGLLFYPWEEYDSQTGKMFPQYHEDVKLDQEPAYTDAETGENYYKCLSCGEIIPESDIYEWVKNTEIKRKYQYPEEIDTEQLEKDLRHLIELLKHHKEEVKKRLDLNERIYDITIRIDDVKSFIDSSSIKKWCNLVKSVGGVYGVVICDYFNRNEIEGRVLNYTDRLLEKTEDEIQWYKDKAKDRNFSVNTLSPLCNDCAENTETCELCDKIMLDPEQEGYPVTWDESKHVCRECVENGSANVCQECGRADSSDDMVYIEDEGSFCSDCAENFTSVEPWRGKIEQAAADNEFPFKEWFPEGENRIYLPFNPDQKLSELDKLIKKELHEKGCMNTNIDYQEGYCHHQGRKFKIVKFINKVRNDETKEIKKMEDITEEEKKNKINLTNDHFNSLIDFFTRSEFRKLKKQNDLEIVISQDPMDIATMSTGRDWTSCMRVGGAHWDDVFCLIEHGSLVAYLIRKNDKNIEEPIGRVLIRRFSNEEGLSLAIAEDTSYGNAPGSFNTFIDEWLESKQTHIPKGLYKRVDNAYSDTFGRTYEKIARLLANAMLKYSGNSWYEKLKY